MAYLWVGNAKNFFNVVGKEDVIASAPEKALINKEIFNKDVPRTHFLGLKKQAESYYKKWQQNFDPQFYVQGSMTAELLMSLFRDQPLMTEDEVERGDFDSYGANRVIKQFAFLDAKENPCGLCIIYRRDDPSQWIVGFMRNGQLEHSKREVCILSSSNLALEHFTFAATAIEVPLFDNQLMNEVKNTSVADILKTILTEDTGYISEQTDNLSFVLRSLITEYGTVTINDPVEFADLDLESLFDVNPALARIKEYMSNTEILLNFSLLQECLEEDSELRKSIESVSFFSENKLIRRSLLNMIIVFHENGSLDSKSVKELLNDKNFIARFAGMLSNRTRILLLPVMRQKRYDEELIKTILSEAAYYNALSMILELGDAYTGDFPRLIQDSEKLRQLQYINEITDTECKKLCYLFWIKGNLTLDGYKHIVEKAKQYPLMSLALVRQDKMGYFPEVADLEQAALNPEKILKGIIKDSFFTNKSAFYTNNSVSGLDELSADDLKEAHRALNVLKMSSWNTKDYPLVVANDKKGIALRLLLPQLERVLVPAEREQLIAVLLKGVKADPNAQYEMVKSLTDKSLQQTAQKLHEQYEAIENLLDMGCSAESVFAAQQNLRAECFRKTKKRIDEQCNRITDYFAGNKSEAKKQAVWASEVLTYRKDFYKIAYDALTAKPGTPEASPAYIKDLIKKKEHEILKKIDPDSNVLRTLIVALANLVLFCLLPVIAHAVHYKCTGDVLFFSRTKVGVALHTISENMDEQIDCATKPKS